MLCSLDVTFTLKGILEKNNHFYHYHFIIIIISKTMLEKLQPCLFTRVGALKMEPNIKKYSDITDTGNTPPPS